MFIMVEIRGLELAFKLSVVNVYQFYHKFQFFRIPRSPCQFVVQTAFATRLTLMEVPGLKSNAGARQLQQGNLALVQLPFIQKTGTLLLTETDNIR